MVSALWRSSPSKVLRFLPCKTNSSWSHANRDRIRILAKFQQEFALDGAFSLHQARLNVSGMTVHCRGFAWTRSSESHFRHPERQSEYVHGCALYLLACDEFEVLQVCLLMTATMEVLQ